MTLITGTFLDSGGVAIALGRLRVQLNAPLVDETPTPDSYSLTVPRDFQITAGALETCNLKQSETSLVSYTFTVFQESTDYTYYYAGTGEYYTLNSDRPSHLYTDSKYYTGVAHTDDSVQLERVASTRLDLVGSPFQAIVPNQSTVDFAQIARTGFATDRTPQSARQVAESLRRDPFFMQSLIDLLVAAPYSVTTLYKRGNIATTGGSAYQCLVDNTIAIAPTTLAPNWRLLVEKGATGGTGGQDTAFNAGTWDGQLWAPSANALRDYLVLLAPIASPTFTGTPAAPTATAGTNTTQLATTAFVTGAIASNNNNTALTGAPTLATDPALDDATSKVVDASWTKGVIQRYSRLSDTKASGTAGGTSATGINTRTLQTIDVNSGDVLSLSADTFTLRPGRYRISAIAQCGAGLAHRLFLWNNTSGARVSTVRSSNAYAASGQISPAQLVGEFTIAANTAFQLRHSIGAGFATTGFGLAQSEASVSEVYAIVELLRVD